MKSVASPLLLGENSLDPLLDALLLLGLGRLGLSVLLGDGLPLLLGLLGAVALHLLPGVGADGGVGLGVEVLEAVGLETVVNVLLELALVALLVVVGQSLHVLGDVAAKDVLLEDLGVQLLRLHVVAGETLLRVGDEDATVRGALHGTKDTGAGGSAGKADVEEDLEGAARAIIGLGNLGEGELTIGLLDTEEVLVKTELRQGTAGNQETGGVGGGPVGKAVLDAVGLELVAVGRGKNLVASDLGRHDLHDDVLVGEADDQAVLGRIVLVLGLGDEALTGVVVGLALTSALVLGLVAARGHSQYNPFLHIPMTGLDERSEAQKQKDIPVVSAVLDQLVERLFINPRVSNLRFRLARPPSEATCSDSCDHEQKSTNAGISAIDEEIETFRG